MVNMNLPDYYNASLIDKHKLENMNEDELLKGYLILNAIFTFQSNIKYPSIPCYMDKNTTVYPLNGECFITGPEYIIAKRQNLYFYF
jgi:hypothetical protein